jgi:hypothetical protein
MLLSLPSLFMECHLCGRRSYKARSRHGCMLGAETRMTITATEETVTWRNPISQHVYRWEVLAATEESEGIGA